MLFNYYGSAVLMLTAVLGMSTHLIGGLGITGSSAFDGWLVIVGVSPFFGYLFDRVEHCGIIRAYITLTIDMVKNMSAYNNDYMPWRRVVFCGAPVAIYPWIALGVGAWHWYTQDVGEGPNPYARFTIACAVIALITVVFGLLTRDHRYIPLVTPDSANEAGITIPERTPWTISGKKLILLNVVLVIPFLALLFTV